MPIRLPLEQTYLQLPEVFYAHAQPVEVAEPKLAIFNQNLADGLGLDLNGREQAELASLFSGNQLPANAKPIAQAYAGHQFGNFTMLGDGRAHLIGELITPQGQRVDLQFKGSGRTPYSRGGDGRAVLRPMLREYLISEAMAALGVPTTRALAVATTGEQVQRETMLPGAILTRIASSHIRVGTFEFAMACREPTLLNALLDYTIKRHAPELSQADKPAIALLEHVIEQQAELVVHWMRVGFVHGVMNTDNTAISGETIDYGPCAFIDRYDPATVFSSIDHNGRYAYANQPAIIQWNLTRFAEALLPAIHEDTQEAIQQAESALHRFPDLYKHKWLEMMRAKLGLFGSEDEDPQLIADLLSWMKANQADYTNTFLDLAKDLSADEMSSRYRDFSDWRSRWEERIQRNDRPIEDAHRLMQRTNPAIIPRNHQVEHALTAAMEADYKPFESLLAALQQPYEDRPTIKAYQSPPEPSEQVYQTFCGT